MPKIGTLIFDVRDRSRVGTFTGWTDHPAFGRRAKVRVVGRATFFIRERHVRHGDPNGKRRGRKRKKIVIPPGYNKYRFEYQAAMTGLTLKQAAEALKDSKETPCD